MPPAGSQSSRCRPSAMISSPRMTSVEPTRSRSQVSGPERTPGTISTGRSVTVENV